MEFSRARAWGMGAGTVKSDPDTATGAAMFAGHRVSI